MTHHMSAAEVMMHLALGHALKAQGGTYTMSYEQYQLLGASLLQHLETGALVADDRSMVHFGGTQ